jgi:hypothetical protein
VEAQWILSVLDDCVNKLILSSFLTPALLDDPILNSNKDRTPIIAHLSDYFESQERYLQMLELRDQSAAAAAAQQGAGASSLAAESAWSEEHRIQLERADDILGDCARASLRLLKVRRATPPDRSPPTC